MDNIVVQQLINGISLGSIYALIALGYTMVYGIVKLINFAHGDILMAGAYTSFFVLSSTGANWKGMIAAFIPAMLVCTTLSVLIERFAYRPLRSASRLNSLITAIAVSLILQNGARVLPFIGPDPRPYPTLMGKVPLAAIQAAIVLLSFALMAALQIIINYTKMGKAMRAVSFDLQASSLMGISINRTITFTFALGAALAAAGGILYATIYPLIEPTMGAMPGLKAFIAAVLGGIGSVPGAMLGAYILGLAETFVKGFLTSQYADAISFAILIIILLVRPTGILGEKLKVKV